VVQSIPATEHSVMTSWPNETEAIKNMINKFGKGVFACVMDSYNYTNALTKVLPRVAQLKIEQGGVMVIRPDRCVSFPYLFYFPVFPFPPLGLFSFLSLNFLFIFILPSLFSFTCLRVKLCHCNE